MPFRDCPAALMKPCIIFRKSLSPDISSERGMMLRELRVSLCTRAKPIAGYWREAGTQNDRKSRNSTRVGRRYKLDFASACRESNKHAPFG